MLFASREERARRMETCKACEHYVATTMSCGPLVTEAFTDSKLCGCYMPAKTKLRTMKCPLDKWDSAVTAEDIEAIRHMLDHKEKYTNQDLVDWHNKMTGGNKNRSTCGPCNNQMAQQLRALVRQHDKG